MILMTFQLTMLHLQRGFTWYGKRSFQELELIKIANILLMKFAFEVLENRTSESGRD